MQTITALISALTAAIYFVYASQVMKKSPGLSSTLTLAAGHLMAALALVPFWIAAPPMKAEFFGPGNQMGALLLVTATLLVLSRELYFYAYARTDVANITVFSSLTPVYALLTGFIFLHEVPRISALVGLALICVSIYGLFLKREEGHSWRATVVQPFRAVGSSRPVLCAFLSTIPTAFAATSQKKLLASLDPFTFSLLVLLLIGLFAAIIAFILFKPSEVWHQLKQLPLGFILASMVLLPLMHVLFCFVMQQQQTAISLVMQRCSIVFQILLAYYFLRERHSIGKRLGAAGFIMLGFILIMSGL